jgi:pilus assembly protein CpaB
MIRRISPRSCAMIALSLAAGLGAAWAARQHLDARVEAIESRARVPMIERIVVERDTEPGIALTLDHLAVRPFPDALVSAYSFGPEQLPELLGQTLRAALSAGEVILPVHLEMPRPVSLSSRLASGRRAITLPVDILNSQAGLLQPGDLIDLYVSFDHQRRRVTAPLLQGVMVLATGDSLDTRSGSGSEADQFEAAGAYATITLDTAPQDAVKLVAARETGVLTAVLRSPDDSEASTVAARGDLATLLGVQPAPPARTRKARVIYGNQSVRNVPGLGSAAAEARLAQGLFQLPYVPGLVSAFPQADHPAGQEGQLSDEDGPGAGDDGERVVDSGGVLAAAPQ